MRIAMMMFVLSSLSEWPAYAKHRAAKKAHARVKVDKHKTQAKNDKPQASGNKNSLDGLPGF